MKEKILITGGAGFIGSHLADGLIERGHQVRILDNLSPQVHGKKRQRPAYLHREAELQVGDIRDKAAVAKALEGVWAVYHLASKVGVGQSMYKILKYTQVNTMGTATLMEALVAQPVERLVVASSMSIYGEGLYRDPQGNPIMGSRRKLDELKDRQWELHQNGQVLEPLPCPEEKRPDLSSVYALSKYDQERLCLICGEAYGIPTTALRFFNVYGTRQALDNPYTGVLAIFAARLLNDRPPLIFEDGAQKRDFVYVGDVVRACILAMERPDIQGEVFNVGSGRAHTIEEIAHRLAKLLGKDIAPEITGKYRLGDIRNCFADGSKAKRVLGFEAQMELDQGLRELAGWLQDQIVADRVQQASEELSVRGLTI